MHKTELIIFAKSFLIFFLLKICDIGCVGQGTHIYFVYSLLYSRRGQALCPPTPFVFGKLDYRKDKYLL